MRKIFRLYADGGVIGSNPSNYGGTWAWCSTDINDEIISFDSGTVTEISSPLPITNNVSELIAIIIGLEQMPTGWSGTVLSDSNISLGRIFKKWAMNGIADQWIDRIEYATHRLGKLDHILLDGHPTKSQLEIGVGKRGHAVSKHNVLCDKLCQNESKKRMSEITLNNPNTPKLSQLP